MTQTCQSGNGAYQLTVQLENGRVLVRLRDLAMDFTLAEAPYLYRASYLVENGTLACQQPRSLSVVQADGVIRLRGTLGRLEMEHAFELLPDKPFLEERIALVNHGDSAVELTGFEAGLQRRITDDVARVLPDVQGDRLVAVPFRVRPTDPPGHVNDFAMADLVSGAGREPRIDANQVYGLMPSRHRFSEGWAWTHGRHTVGLFKFNQENMEFSVISTVVRPDGLWLRFGGACMVSGEPSVLNHIAPGQRVQLGLMRYQTVEGGYTSAYDAFRGMLDEKACRFPADYDPPVQWNELYDNQEWWLATPGSPDPSRPSTRATTYTRPLIELEAAKAKEYSCQALYLDPGWDTDFGTLIWGEEWMGPRKEFIQDMKAGFGLSVSLHCPLATWMSLSTFRRPDHRGAASWPRESFRMGDQGRIVEGSVCLGSRQYLQEAEARLSAHCADGVVFLMFDGNFWNGGCWNPAHGHPVPYRMEDHIRGNLELAQRIHARFPKVLIEMHDMISGGVWARWTPVYYKYGLPGSYDENWGFELMWSPFEDLRNGRAKALYYYNLGCNVPVYLHIDLRDDNENCLIFWWFASTCRHLGIGGTHPRPAVAEAQKWAMRRYRSLDRFYKRGQFIGISEEVHLHVLAQENAFVVNVFNLSDQPRRIEGSIPVARLGIDPDRWYGRSDKWARFHTKDLFCVSCELPPWDTRLIEFAAV